MTATLKIGDAIPALTVTAADGTVRGLASLATSPLVVYFYPKADTPGCTNEAKDFTALAAEFAAAGARVVGVSRDTPAKLGKFAAKYDLAVELVADIDGSVTEGFGVWVEKSMYGRSYMGIERATFLFDAAGKLVRHWPKVKVKGHADEVLAAVKSL